MTFSYGLLHIDTLLLADQQKLTFTSCVWTLDAVWKIYRELWTLGMDGNRESKESVLSAYFDDYGNDDYVIRRCVSTFKPL